MTPFKGLNRVTSPFGPRTLNGRRENHKGQDSVPTKYPGEPLPESAWQVREVTGGTVIRIGYDKSRGNYVDIRTSARHFERYQHLKSIVVKVGQKVSQGQLIGVAGNTGTGTARHLHFGVYKVGANTDHYKALKDINTLEQYAVPPQQWSGVPNALGTYKGNDTLDTPPPVNTLKTLTIGPMSAGDVITLENMAKDLRLRIIGEAMSGVGTILTIGPMSAGDRVTIAGKAAELLLPVTEK
ncbi:M23 family metallopeptidase [Ruminococcaceae bacterium OttesenSCG-928-A16]|nr:M23 family metallopeptidase [Ruminococcaceae bacterium OttesenSCG-928-A16]